MLRQALKQTRYVLKVAHRGCSPENKMAGFNNAVLQGCDMIECDIHLSRDGVPIIIHDKSINRTTKSKGLVSQMSVSELTEHDIPSLEELLIWFQDKPRLMGAFELKNQTNGRNDDLIEAVHDLFSFYKVQDKSILISFDKSILKKSKDICPDFLTGYIHGPCPGVKCPQSIAKQVKADVLWLHFSLWHGVSEKQQDLPIFLWTVNDKIVYKNLINNKKNNFITGIVTDDLSIM